MAPGACSKAAFKRQLATSKGDTASPQLSNTSRRQQLPLRLQGSASNNPTHVPASLTATSAKGAGELDGASHGLRAEMGLKKTNFCS
jgi:hypothetical protein